MSQFVKENHVVTAFAAVDLNTAAVNGDYISLKGYDHCSIVITCGAGSAGSAVTLSQAQSVAGTGDKALGFNTVFKAAAHATSDVLIETAVVSDTFTTEAAGGDKHVIEIDADMLDVDNGFDCLRVKMSDPGASNIASSEYILTGRRYQAGESVTQSAIVD